MLNVQRNSNESNSRMEHDILHAAQFNDFEEASLALKNDPNCVTKTNQHRMNAVQIALIEFNDDMVIYLIQESSISMLNKDLLERDALDIAREIGSDQAYNAVHKKWNEQMTKLLNEDEPKVTPIKPPSPK